MVSNTVREYPRRLGFSRPTQPIARKDFMNLNLLRSFLCSRFCLKNACHSSVQNLLCSCVLFKNINSECTELYFCLLFCMSVIFWIVILKKEIRTMVFQNRVRGGVVSAVTQLIDLTIQGGPIPARVSFFSAISPARSTGVSFCG
jgi:hypothetical protein